MRWFFLLLPWAELFTLIKLGGSIGALATLFYVFATFVLGMSIVRLQGMELIGNLRQAEYGQFVSRQMLASELAVGLGGLLLIIPGKIFSQADTHFRISYAASDATIERGINMLLDYGNYVQCCIVHCCPNFPVKHNDNII